MHPQHSHQSFLFLLDITVTKPNGTVTVIATIAKRWFTRRQDAVNAVLKDVSDEGASRSVLTALPIKSFELLADDMSDWLALCATCAQTLSKGEIEAESEMLEVADKKRDPDKLPTRIPV